MNARERQDTFSLIEALRYWIPIDILDKYRHTADPILLRHIDTWYLHMGLIQRIETQLERERPEE